MKIAGIIAEYNPFHRGHAWHVAETRRITGCDFVVACMDGHFTQRGDPALFSKWNRVRMALSCGVDAVFELPTLFAVRTADAFARGGVAILGGLGVDCLSFGCEIDDIDIISTMVGLLHKEPTSVALSVRDALARGESHARARGNAIADYLNLPREMVNRPNLTLALEYVKAMQDLNLKTDPVPVLRRGDYHGGDLGEYASASAIRAAFLRGDMTEALACLPENAQPWGQPESLHAMDDLLMYRLRQMSSEEMANLPDVAEGLEHRLYRLCRETGTREELLDALKCKRYTRARLSRMLTHVLVGMDRAFADSHPMPTYARLLGLRRDADGLMGELKRRSTLPIAASADPLREDPVFQLECRATDIWSLLNDKTDRRRSGRELTEKFISI